MVNVANTFVAHASYFEQNAVWTRANPNPNPTITPEPGTLLLLGAGLGAALIVQRRRASTCHEPA